MWFQHLLYALEFFSQFTNFWYITIGFKMCAQLIYCLQISIIQHSKNKSYMNIKVYGLTCGIMKPQKSMIAFRQQSVPSHRRKTPKFFNAHRANNVKYQTYNILRTNDIWIACLQSNSIIILQVFVINQHVRK